MRNKKAREIKKLSKKGEYDRNKKTYSTLNRFDRKKFINGLKNSAYEPMQ
jgi:hypothetical protein